MLQTADEKAEYRGEAMAVRATAGGVLMGLANLVPGISGGTMLLAAGIYPQFINGVAEVSTFRFRGRTVLVLTCVVVAAVAAILMGAGPVSAMVVNHRWIMYSLFIGLTLGGVPILWSMFKPPDAVVVTASIIGIAVMAVMATVRPEQAGAADGSHHYLLSFLAGLAGASAMVLPGVSGGYLLLVLGQYVVILTAVSTLKDGLKAADMELIGAAMHVVVPVGLGVLVGVVGVSNLVKVLLERFERATLGVLLGLLLGAVIGLWPFQEGIAPEVGSVFRGDTVVEGSEGLMMESTGRLIEPADYRTGFFTPAAGQIGGSAAIILLGFAVSFGISHLGRSAETRTGARRETSESDTPKGGDLRRPIKPI